MSTTFRAVSCGFSTLLGRGRLVTIRRQIRQNRNDFRFTAATATVRNRDSENLTSTALSAVCSAVFPQVSTYPLHLGRGAHTRHDPADIDAPNWADAIVIPSARLRERRRARSHVSFIRRTSVAPPAAESAGAASSVRR